MGKSKKISIGIFFVLLVSLFILTTLNFKKYKLPANTQKSAQSPVVPKIEKQNPHLNQDLVTANGINLPVPMGSPGVSGVLVHYFFTGKINEIVPLGSETKISIDSSEKSIPSFIVTNETRVSHISQPYSEKTSFPIKIGDLKIGQSVDISAEYDLMQKKWFTRDVFLPTDRNK